MKKGITIGIIVLVVLGFAYWLFAMSPQEQGSQSGGYNAAISTPTNVRPLAAVPAFDPATDHYLGNKNAKNVFIEYGDMQCPYCAQFNPMLVQIPSQLTDTVFVFRYFPLLQHKNTVEASLAAEAAGSQGKFWEMHDLLYAKQAEWENETDPLNLFAQYAQQVGVVNLNQFKSDITNKKYLDPLRTGENQSYGLQLKGTPSYFYNGHALDLNKITDMNSLKQQALPFAVK